MLWVVSLSSLSRFGPRRGRRRDATSDRVRREMLRAGIKPKDIQEIKANKNPTDIIKMIFDCILILFKLPLEKVPTQCLSRNVSELQYHEDGVRATPRPRDAVDGAVRDPPRLASEPRDRGTPRNGPKSTKRPPPAC